MSRDMDISKAKAYVVSFAIVVDQLGPAQMVAAGAMNIAGMNEEHVKELLEHCLGAGIGFKIAITSLEEAPPDALHPAFNMGDATAVIVGPDGVEGEGSA